jgi:hypothetical protein
VHIRHEIGAQHRIVDTSCATGIVLGQSRVGTKRNLTLHIQMHPFTQERGALAATVAIVHGPKE